MQIVLKKPWYREPWPWILMSGPLVVVVAACFTAWIAYTRADPLVTEDYYRKGLQAGHTIASSERASALGLQAKVSFKHDTIRIALAANKQALALPATLRITLSHPTRAGLDQKQVLNLRGGYYEGALQVPESGHWLLLIEDDLQAWRLLGKVVLPSDAEIGITALQ